MEISYVLVIVYLTFKSIDSETTDGYLKEINNFNTTSSENVQIIIDSSAFKRLKREPAVPFTTIKQKTRLIKEPPKPRGRIKYPRTAYGPPSYKNEEPFYRPQSWSGFGSVIRARPEYVILQGSSAKIKPGVLLVEDNQSKRKFGYVLSGANSGKSTTQYIIYETEKKPSTNNNYQLVLRGHEIYSPPLRNNNLAYSKKPHEKYGVPTSYDPPLKDINEEDKNPHLVYAHEFGIKTSPPAKQYQVPNKFPESFKGGLIGPSYLPPQDFHKGYNYTKKDYISNKKLSSEIPVQVELDEVFDTSKLPLEDLKMHPNFDYQKTSYEVPIYEPVVFTPEAIGKHEFFPPNLSDTFNEQKFSTIVKGSTKIEVTLPKKPDSIHSREAKEYKARKKQGTPSAYPNQFSMFENGLQSLRTSIDILSQTPSSVPSELTTSSPTRTSKIRRGRKKKRKTRVSNAKRHVLDIEDLKALVETPQNKFDMHAFLNNPLQNDRYRVPVIPSWESVKIRNSSDLKDSDKAKSKNVTLLSIQKSQSNSYYDGTVPPETIKRLLYNSQIDNDDNNQHFQSALRKSRSKDRVLSKNTDLQSSQRKSTVFDK